MTNNRYEEWLQNKDEHLESFAEPLPQQPPKEFFQCLEKAINTYFIQSLILSTIGSKATTLRKLDMFVKKASGLVVDWDNIKELVGLMAIFPIMENSAYNFNESSELFTEYVHQISCLVTEAKGSINAYLGDIRKGAPKKYYLTVFIANLTDAYLTLDLPIDFQSETYKDQFADGLYCRFMVKPLAVVGEYISIVTDRDIRRNSGIVTRISDFLNTYNLK